MKQWICLTLLLFLAACGGLSQPFSKAEPLPPANSIIAPPWEAMVAAGPGAANDIDLETLNGPAPAPTDMAASQPPVTPAQKPTGKEITAVAVVKVQGGTASGDMELTNAMRDTLAGGGWKVLEAPAKTALTIIGQVKIAPANGATQKVTLSWDVQSPDGKSLGDIKQANDVPAGSLDKGWGPNAAAVTEAAASGIYELINKYR